MNKAAQALGSLGGKARARSLTKARKREIASLAGKASQNKRKRATDGYKRAQRASQNKPLI